ncbi:hypothetical protein EV183_002103 [Coemansia sp. RSA 2336]|nr:hypothetical protein EV183_002103 [Coemansia sp. RSA 2336]
MFCRSAAVRLQRRIATGHSHSVHLRLASRCHTTAAVAVSQTGSASYRHAVKGQVLVSKRLQHIHKRSISVQPLYETSCEPAKTSDIPRQAETDKLAELASDIKAALRSSQSLVLDRWADRIERISDYPPRRRFGVLYTTGKETQAAQLAGALIENTDVSSNKQAFISQVQSSLSENATAIASFSPDVGMFDKHGMSFLATAVANTNRELFADWLYECEQVIMLTDRVDIVQSLIGTSGLWLATRFHPRTCVVVDGLESSAATVEAFAGLLHESLEMLGASTPQLGPTPCPVLPQDLDAKTAKLLTATRYNDRPSQRRLLASALDASLACLENGGAVPLAVTPPSGKAKEVVQSEASMLVTSRLGAFISNFNELGQLSLPSKRIQEDFENGDLQSIDSSIGAIKSRVEEWFASGKIWQTVLMRVCEVSDSLVEDAIVDRSFEEVDMAMVHAAGRLNESVKCIASDLASEIDTLDSNVSLGTVAMAASNPSAVVTARNDLLALAAQKEPIDPFKLARYVWAARQRLEQSDMLESIPQYIRKSLLVFWSGNALALTATAASAIYFGVPALVAASAAAAQSLATLLLLGRRWNRLRSNLYAHLDTQGTFLRTELSAAHKSVLQTELDSPVSSCVKAIAGLQSLATADSGQSAPQSIINSWKSRLSSAL